MAATATQREIRCPPTASNGRFVSITVTIMATSQQQLDDIYRDASSHDDVLMAL